MRHGDESLSRRWGLVGLALLALITAVLVGAAVLRPPIVADATPVPTVAKTPSLTPSPTAGTPSAAPTATTEPAGTIVVLGDRYTADAAWPVLVGDRSGLRVVNLAQAGMGYITAPQSCEQGPPCTPFRGLLERIRAESPEVLVLAGGEADGDNTLVPFAAPTLSELRQGLPDTRILVLPPPSARSPQPYWLSMHTRVLQEAAESAGVTFVHAAPLVGNSDSYEGGQFTLTACQELSSLVVDTLH